MSETGRPGRLRERGEAEARSARPRTWRRPNAQRRDARKRRLTGAYSNETRSAP